MHRACRGSGEHTSGHSHPTETSGSQHQHALTIRPLFASPSAGAAAAHGPAGHAAALGRASTDSHVHTSSTVAAQHVLQQQPGSGGEGGAHESFESDWDVMGAQPSSEGMQGNSLTAAGIVTTDAQAHVDAAALERLQRHAEKAAPQSWATPTLQPAAPAAVPPAPGSPRGSAASLHHPQQRSRLQAQQQGGASGAFAAGAAGEPGNKGSAGKLPFWGAAPTTGGGGGSKGLVLQPSGPSALVAAVAAVAVGNNKVAPSRSASSTVERDAGSEGGGAAKGGPLQQLHAAPRKASSLSWAPSLQQGGATGKADGRSQLGRAAAAQRPSAASSTQSSPGASPLRGGAPHGAGNQSGGAGTASPDGGGGGADWRSVGPRRGGAAGEEEEAEEEGGGAVLGGGGRAQTGRGSLSEPALNRKSYNQPAGDDLARRVSALRHAWAGSPNETRHACTHARARRAAEAVG